MDPSTITVVLGEDDDGHALLVTKNLKRVGLHNIVHLRDGREVLDFFDRALEPRRIEPMLVLLDINMPRVDGVTALQQLKSSPVTARVPVIMLTTTDDPREIARCYELGCNIYVTKPVVYEQFVEAIARLGMFLSVVRVPSYARLDG